MLDSAAAFKDRAASIGVTAAELARLEVLNLDTFGKLAYGCSYVPGQADDQPLLTLRERVCEAAPPPEERVPVIRRLFFESYTLANADLRSRVDRKDDEQPRKLAQAERAARHKDQQVRLAGLELVGELEPSHSLVDLVFHMLEENQLRHIRWEQCTKRDQELLGIRHDPLWKPGADGVVREVRQKEEALADTSSDLHLKHCLQRRSLALDQARIIDYEKMERWSRTMLEAYSALPIDGYKKVSLDQIQRADLELFKFLMKHSREGIRPSGGVAPLEAILDRAITSAEIRLRLAPLPAGSGSGIKRKHDDLEPETANKAKHSPDDIAKLKRTIENLTGQVRNLKSRGSSKQPPTGKGNKGLGRGSKGMMGRSYKSTVKMPPELVGQSPMTDQGEPICYSYNLDGCNEAAPGQRCPKGWHVCTRPGCQAVHSQRNHK